MGRRLGGGKLIKKIFGNVDIKTANVEIPDSEMLTDSEEAISFVLQEPNIFARSYSKKRRGKHANLRKFSAPTGGRFP